MEVDQSNPKQVLMDKLETEIVWQWKWEKLNRSLYVASQWISWLANLIVFILALLLTLPGFPKTHLVRMLIVITASSGISIFTQLINHTMKFQSRQQLHDKMAREYDVLLLLMRTNSIELPKALRRFEAIHKKPVEPQIQ